MRPREMGIPDPPRTPPRTPARPNTARVVPFWVTTRSRRHARPRARRDERSELWGRRHSCEPGRPAARLATTLVPGEQARETSTAARAAVVVLPRAHRGISAPRANAAPVRGTRERKAVGVGEAWEGWLATCAGPIYRSRFDMGKCERTVE